MTTLEALKAARRKIENPENWLQQAFAQDKEGNRVMSTDPQACSFCAIGAVRNLVGYGREEEECSDALREAVGISMLSFNDSKGRTHAEVIAAFDVAIAKLERPV